MGSRSTFYIKAILFILPIVLSGCSTMQKAQPTGLTQERFLLAQRDRQNTFRKISAKLSLRYGSVQETLSGKGRFTQGDKNQYRLELRDPLGRTYFLATQSNNRFQAQYPRQSKVFVDESGGKIYFQKMGINSLDLASIVDISLGLLPASWLRGNFASWNWDESAAMYRGIAKQGEQEVEVLVDGKTAALTSILVRNPTVVAEVHYSDFDACCDGFDREWSLARFVDIRWPRVKTYFEFEWGDLVPLTQAPDPYLFNPAVDKKWKVTR